MASITRMYLRWGTNILKVKCIVCVCVCVLSEEGILRMFQLLISAWIPNTVWFFLTFPQLTRQMPRQYIELATTTSIQALSISLVTNQTAAVFGNIANCPFSVKNIRYLLVLSTLPDISGNVLKYRANLLYTVIIKSFGKSPTTLVTPVLSWTLTQELGPSIHWQVTYQFPETQATVDVNNFLFRSFHCIVCTWQSIWPEQANGYMERNIVFKRKVSFYCFRVVFINRSLELLARYLVSLVII
jgi:hypothetical protein